MSALCTYHYMSIINKCKKGKKIPGQGEDTDWKGSCMEEVTPVRNLVQSAEKIMVASSMVMVVKRERNRFNIYVRRRTIRISWGSQCEGQVYI